MSETDGEAQPGKSHWPQGVQEINIGQVSMLGVDSGNRLYWDGKPVKVQERFSLSFWQGLAAFLIVTFTVIGGIGSAAQGWAAAHQWSCQIKWTTWACPPVPSLSIQRPISLPSTGPN